MAQLEAAGLVTAQRDGRQMVYRADFCGMRGLVKFLLEDCCRGDAAPRAPDTNIRPGWWSGNELGLIGDSIYLTDQ